MADDVAHSVDVYLKTHTDGPFLGMLRYEKGRGVHDERKAIIKERGARWTPNPRYVEGQPRRQDGAIEVRGWWAAPSRAVLVELLQLKPGAGLGTKSLWMPCGLGALGASMLLRRCVEEKRMEDAADALSRKKREPSLADKEREERSRLDIPDDSEEEIAELQQLGVVYSSALMERARRFTSQSTGSTFGPRSGISDAARMLRGVRLGIVTVEEAKECAQHEDLLTDVAPSSEQVQEEEDMYKIAKRQRVASTDDGYDHCLGASLDTTAPFYDAPPVDTVTCEECDEPVDLQFMACACAYSEWERAADGSLSRLV